MRSIHQYGMAQHNPNGLFSGLQIINVSIISVRQLGLTRGEITKLYVESHNFKFIILDSFYPLILTYLSRPSYLGK